LVFDDSFEHEVWNESTERRLVLLFDIFHPDLTDVEQCALKFLAGQWRNTAMRQAVAKTLVTAGSDA
jgi:aspartate beta-hydroxylase